MKIAVTLRTLRDRIRRDLKRHHFTDRTEAWLRAHGRAIIADIDSMRKSGRPAEDIEQFVCYRVEYAYKHGLHEGAAVARRCVREAMR